MPIFLSKSWENYYKNINTFAEYRSSRCFYDRDAQVDNLWFKAKNELKVPVTTTDYAGTPLSQCWLPDTQAQKILWKFLPVINLQAFPEEYRKEVAEWLRYEMRLREGLNELKLEEWQEILQSLPRRYPASRYQEDAGARNAVGAIYRAFLELPLATADLSEVAWLCRKGNEWNYAESCWGWMTREMYSLLSKRISGF